jgi:hypothetical protein
MTQAHANWINRPGQSRSLPRQLPPKIGGVMQLRLIGTPALPRWLAQSGLAPELRFNAPMSLPLTPIDIPASWNLWIPVSAQQRRWR